MLSTNILAKYCHESEYKIIRVLMVFLLTGLMFVLMGLPEAIAAENGQVLFEQTCAGCHTLDGTGKGFAPDLKGITEKRDRSWLNRWILQPDQMITEKDAIAMEILAKYNNVPMPNMGLNQEQVTAIIEYLASTNQQALKPNNDNLAAEKINNFPEVKQPNQIAIATNSLTVKGAELFTGKTRFEKQTPACISCHSAGIGALNGGTLGPDLTHVFGRYGEIGLSSVLQTLPYPTMLGIYQNKPLNAEEQKALLAFFQTQDNVNKNVTMSLALTPSMKFGLIGLGGCLLLLGLSNWIWRDRFTGVRNKLVSQTREN